MCIYLLMDKSVKWLVGRTEWGLECIIQIKEHMSVASYRGVLIGGGQMA